MGFDIIGDVHGHANALKALLRRLDYEERSGAWRHGDGRRAGRADPESRSRTCLDFSIAKGGVLCAYRFDDESELDDGKLLWVP